MKIAHLMIGNGWGGVQSFFRDCCFEMSARGHEILAVVRENSWLNEVMLREHTIFQLVTVRNRFGNYDPFTIKEFREILCRFSPDIVVSHGQRSTLFAGRVKKAGEFGWPQVSLVQANLKQKYYKYADVLIPHTKSQACLDYHVDLVKPNFSEVIPLFTSIDCVQKVKRMSSISNIFSAGRLHVVKGYKHLIEAIHRLTNLGFDIQLTIAGDGPEKERLMRQRDALNLQNRVHFIGSSNRVASLMRQFDLFVLPSISEPFGIVLLEAMASGVPIVATKTNGPLEILDENTAILVEANSEAALRKGIQTAVGDIDSTIQRARNSLNLFKDCYSADVLVPKYINLFHDLIKQRNSLYP